MHNIIYLLVAFCSKATRFENKGNVKEMDNEGSHSTDIKGDDICNQVAIIKNEENDSQHISSEGWFFHCTY